ncbi:myo-inositol-1(or 4)-monophosphatase [Amphibacillus marinus]|uniref:Myo-inositol-1(Or 4)-monophosphatase n=1 Tax=Amphibacillus marinus TaxID=872970 RepID=A0A1H8S7K2_9BACI|nr:inositol monophosphatase family protein [Amphibacillus marinus]SEO74133.1 myo-inositol-1(or 4)-monophosphatase [Amphibacillus marinus]
MVEQAIYQHAKQWAFEAGEILRQAVKGELTVEYKTSAADLVTEKDKEIEQFFLDKINTHYPEHFLLGEEGVQQQQTYQPEDEIVWLVDPIDGTTNFVHTKSNFSISVAVYIKGKPTVGVIYDPIKDEMFHVLAGQGLYVDEEKVPAVATNKQMEEALFCLNHLWLAPNDDLNEQPLQQMVREIRGFRCIGSAALELAYVATGRMDGAIYNGLGAWDFGAAYVMLKEQGIACTTLKGEEVYPFGHATLITASKKLHQQVLANYIELKH